jgi:hypothetical protein
MGDFLNIGRVLKFFQLHEILVLRRANAIRPYRKIWIVGANGIHPVRQHRGFKTRPSISQCSFSSNKNHQLILDRLLEYPNL